MTDQTNQDPQTENDPTDEQAGAELTVLKARADMLGISYSNNIKVETLRARIEAKLAETEEAEQKAEAAAEDDTPAARDARMRMELQNDAMRLIRCRITNLDPKKRDLHGEIFTIGNEFIGTVRKFVPYGEATDEGFHIPFCIYQELEDRRFLHVRTVTDRRTGQINTTTSWQKEFALEVLPQLTEEELRDLATAQAAAGSVQGGNGTEYLN